MANPASPAPASSEEQADPAPQAQPNKQIVPPPAGAPPEDESEPAANAAKPELTPEEQMALYEKALKEDDWGHQPC